MPWLAPGMTPLDLFRVVALAAGLGLLSIQAALAGGPIQRVTNNPSTNIRPAFSPDGKWIAYQSNRSGLFEIYVVDADGSNERRISLGDHDDRHPAWSPDGRQVAVDTGTDAQREIWTVDLTTGARHQVTHLAGIASFPSWSPDGSQLSFFFYQAGTLDLMSIGVDGSDRRTIRPGIASEKQSQCTFACHAAVWSPDGSRLAYASTTSPSEVWTMRASDATDLQRVSPDGRTGSSHFPAYLADGRLVYVTEHITPGRAWTDVWAVRPDAPDQPQALLEEVQAQGPFDFSSDATAMLFASPRGGNFEIYVVELNDEGKAALKVSTSAEAAAAPAAQSVPPAVSTSQPVAAPAQASPTGPGGVGVSVYLVALMALGLVWGGVELAVFSRRRRKTRGK
jgi:Tol biopolymer transport system component